MKENRFVASLFVSALLLSACGASTKGAQVVKGPMPDEGNFDGVYQSDFGRLELTVDASGNASGLYEKNDEYGRIAGEVNGNLLVFSWTQWNEEMRGKTRETSGRGVFQYVIEEVATTTTARKYHQLKGWWNYGSGELVNPWNAAKLSSRAKKRLKPYEPSAGGMAQDQEDYDQSVGFDESGGSSAPSGSSSEPAEEPEEDQGTLDIF